jgi:hypothetical protein
MRAGLLAFILFAIVLVGARRHVTTAGRGASVTSLATLFFSSNPPKPDFETQIKPIFQTRCQPCHFPGGKVYDRMPFDKPETINRLGEKLFTRIKDKDEQRLIREFLAQP